MKIVVLDGYTENPGDLSWSELEKLGDVTVYDRTSYVEAPIIAERIGDAEVVITAYGTPARIALTAIEMLREEGLKVGLFRPITLWPFPEDALRKLSKAGHVKAFLDVEMSSCGQMMDDVRLSVEGRKPIRYLGHAGGVMPTAEEIVDAAKAALKEGA